MTTKSIFLKFILVHPLIRLGVCLLPQILHLYLKKADAMFIIIFYYCGYIVHYAKQQSIMNDIYIIIIKKKNKYNIRLIQIQV
jgi:hypothetical protein